MAQDLKSLNLFQGVSDSNFDLNRQPTRIEALVILVRMLGKEAEAQCNTWHHPFEDVPNWANPYIGYAYENGLTNGISDTQFGTGIADAKMFLTFVLRSLGYSDKDGVDFAWDNPFELATNIGIYNNSIDIQNFWRADIVYITYAALQANIKNSSLVLSEKLIQNGVFLGDTFDEIYDNSKLSSSNSQNDVSFFNYEIPDYAGTPYVILNNNTPYFKMSELSCTVFEEYSPLDDLGRCGVAFANICQELMPTESRASIGSVKPSGWHTIRYDGMIDGNYLYNRCHLIGFQLAGENANPNNLITGTRYLNIEGMLPFENMVADYVKETGHHVLYRATPIFEDKNLVASGVLMEAFSVEDLGEGICFCIYCYNVQPGIIIEYDTGNSFLNDLPLLENKSANDTLDDNIYDLTQIHSEIYILNIKTKKFHLVNCPSVSQMAEQNKQELSCSQDTLLIMGYIPCRNCMF